MLKLTLEEIKDVSLFYTERILLYILEDNKKWLRNYTATNSDVERVIAFNKAIEDFLRKD